MTKDKQAQTETTYRKMVKIAMIEKDIKSQAEIAKRIGKSTQAVGQAIIYGRYPEVRKLINKELGLPEDL